MSLETRVKQILSTTFKIPLDEVKANTNADNTPAWDSLSHLRLVMALEREFDITIDPKHFSKISDVKGIVEVVTSYTEEG